MSDYETEDEDEAEQVLHGQLVQFYKSVNPGELNGSE
jgi:hypothetical protein